MTKLKQRKIKQVAENHMAGKCRSKTSNPGRLAFNSIFFFFFFFFLKIYLFIYGRHRERERGRDTGRGRSRSLTELDPGTPGPCPGPKTGTKPLSHQGMKHISMDAFQLQLPCSPPRHLIPLMTPSPL